MIVPIPRSTRTSEDNVLPLINIVFLLLIFFMMAGALSAATPFPVDPPETRAAEATDPPADRIALGPEGRLAFAGEELSIEDLGDAVERWQQTADPGQMLAVQADAEASTRQLLEVIDILRASDVDTIRLLTVGGAEDE